MEREVNIKTTDRKFFQQYLRVLKPVLKPYLSNGELNVLGEILYYNNKYKSIDPKLRTKVVFDYDTKAEIMKSLNISQNTLANNLTSLRKKGYLVKGEVTKGLGIFPNEEYIIKYKFRINNGVEDK